LDSGKRYLWGMPGIHPIIRMENSKIKSCHANVTRISGGTLLADVRHDQRGDLADEMIYLSYVSLSQLQATPHKTVLFAQKTFAQCYYILRSLLTRDVHFLPLYVQTIPHFIISTLLYI